MQVNTQSRNQDDKRNPRLQPFYDDSSDQNVISINDD